MLCFSYKVCESWCGRITCDIITVLFNTHFYSRHKEKIEMQCFNITNELQEKDIYIITQWCETWSED